jgi:FAD/FMN-containing dehydrogenase
VLEIPGTGSDGRAPRRGGPDAARRHEVRVARISDQLRRRRSTTPLSLRKKAVSHQVPKRGDAKYSDEQLDISELDEILSIDPVSRTCVAESGVTFVELVTATLRRGLVPIIVPELKTITVGGAVSGCSIESASFKYGGFHDTCLEYEVITATGDVLVCRPDNDNRLLFHMMHGTFGTLGILSRLTFRLIPAQPYVQIDYQRFDELADFHAAIGRHAETGDADFVDGMVHTPDDLVLAVGHFVEAAPYTNRYDWTKVYYQSTRRRPQDFLTTEAYFFRYDRGVTNVHPKSWLGRLLLGKLFGSSELLRLAEKANRALSRERPAVTVDLFLPYSKVPAFLEWHTRELGHFPLWCVPYARVQDYPWLADSFYRGLSDRLFVDFAIYGMEQPADGRNYYRLIEEKLFELGGMKTLISHNYYSEDEFWRTWNRPSYQRVKAIADPNNIFRDLYTKTCQAAQGRGQARGPGDDFHGGGVRA